MENRSNYISYLEEIRHRLIRVGVFFVLVSIGCCFFSAQIVSFLLEPIQKSGNSLYFFAPYDGFLVYLKAGFLGGLVISIPVFLWQIWLFVKPALSKSESLLLFVVIWGGAIFTTAGAIFAYLLIVPIALDFFVSFESEMLKPLLSAHNYLSFCFNLVIAFGVVFNLPIISFVLTKLQLINSKMMSKHRKEVVLGIFVVAAMITPPDVVTQVLLAGPLILLYECAVVVSFLSRV